MTATFDTVLQDAMRLSLEDRSRIATRLLASVDEEDDFELTPAWRSEIEKRVAAIKEGSAVLVPHDEAMNSVRQLIADAARS